MNYHCLFLPLFGENDDEDTAVANHHQRQRLRPFARSRRGSVYAAQQGDQAVQDEDGSGFLGIEAQLREIAGRAAQERLVDNATHTVEAAGDKTEAAAGETTPTPTDPLPLDLADAISAGDSQEDTGGSERWEMFINPQIFDVVSDASAEEKQEDNQTDAPSLQGDPADFSKTGQGRQDHQNTESPANQLPVQSTNTQVQPQQLPQPQQQSPASSTTEQASPKVLPVGLMPTTPPSPNRQQGIRADQSQQPLQHVSHPGSPNRGTAAPRLSQPQLQGELRAASSPATPATPTNTHNTPLPRAPPAQEPPGIPGQQHAHTYPVPRFPHTAAPPPPHRHAGTPPLAGGGVTSPPRLRKQPTPPGIQPLAPSRLPHGQPPQQAPSPPPAQDHVSRSNHPPPPPSSTYVHTVHSPHYTSPPPVPSPPQQHRPPPQSLPMGIPSHPLPPQPLRQQQPQPQPPPSAHAGQHSDAISLVQDEPHTATPRYSTPPPYTSAASTMRSVKAAATHLPQQQGGAQQQAPQYQYEQHWKLAPQRKQQPPPPPLMSPFQPAPAAAGGLSKPVMPAMVSSSGQGYPNAAQQQHTPPQQYPQPSPPNNFAQPAPNYPQHQQPQHRYQPRNNPPHMPPPSMPQPQQRQPSMPQQQPRPQGPIAYLPMQQPPVQQPYPAQPSSVPQQPSRKHGLQHTTDVLDSAGLGGSNKRARMNNESLRGRASDPALQQMVD